MNIKPVDVKCVTDLDRCIKYSSTILLSKRVILQRYIEVLWKLNLTPELWRIN